MNELEQLVDNINNGIINPVEGILRLRNIRDEMGYKEFDAAMWEFGEKFNTLYTGITGKIVRSNGWSFKALEACKDMPLNEQVEYMKKQLKDDVYFPVDIFEKL